MNTQELCTQIKERIDSVNNLQELNTVKVEYLGKTGIITNLQSKIKEIPNDEKKEYGMKVNEIKNKYLSKKGIITDLSSNMKNIDSVDKKEYGMLINEV